jgi:hypothetical protein
MSTSGSESRNELLGLIDTAIKTHQRRHHAPSGMLYWKHEDQMTEDALQAARAFIQSAGGASGFADWLRSHPFEPRRSGARIYTLDDLMAAWQAARSIPSHVGDRDAIIEECARVADAPSRSPRIAALIRELKDKP